MPIISSILPAIRGTLRLSVVAVVLMVGPPAGAHVAVTAVRVDGRDLPLSAAANGREPVPVRIPANARQVDFRFRGDIGRDAGRAPPAADRDARAPGTRLRFRLDGRDTTWRDLPAAGRARLHFLDAQGVTVGGESVALEGESPGWRAAAETSDFLPQECAAVAPPGSEKLVLSFLVADPVVGCLGIDDIAVRIERRGEAPIVWPFTPLDIELDDLQPFSTPSGWSRPGTRPEMCMVRIRAVPAPHPILVIVDDEPERFGNWATVHRPAIEVRPGDRVTLSWTASYSFGLGGEAGAEYLGLAPGNYWFRVGAFRANGDATGDEASLPVVVMQPLHLRSDVWAGGVACLVAGGMFVGRVVASQRLKRRLADLERAHSLERERARIARDLHDEIGAGLTEIAMQADAVRSEMQGLASADALHYTDGICRTAVDLVRSVDAIVWAVNPAHDTLDRFAAYLLQSTEQFLDASGLSMRFDVPARLPPLPLDGTVRHRLFLAVREALNNAVKHAGAGTVTLSLRQEGGRLEVEVMDDGRGFDPGAALLGADHDGLANMRQRMQEIGGTCSITSQSGAGTRVRLALPYPSEPATQERAHA
jgi:signal transduction histidine kinase